LRQVLRLEGVAGHVVAQAIDRILMRAHQGGKGLLAAFSSLLDEQSLIEGRQLRLLYRASDGWLSAFTCIYVGREQKLAEEIDLLCGTWPDTPVSLARKRLVRVQPGVCSYRGWATPCRCAMEPSAGRGVNWDRFLPKSRYPLLIPGIGISGVNPYLSE